MQVTINWTPNPEAEQIKQYNLYTDGTLMGSTPTNSITVDIQPGVHTIEIAPVNTWGEGPKSDPVITPPAPTKPTGVTISVTVSVVVNP